MKASLIQVQSREGVGKKSGKEYKINTLTFMTPISYSDEEKKSEFNVLTTRGFKLIRFDVENEVYERVNGQATMMPVEVDLNIVIDSNRDGDSITVLESVTFPET